MTSIRLVSSSLHIFAGVLLITFLHASSNAPVGAATSPKSKSNLIKIWTVGSPYTGALPRAVVPPDLRQRAESLGYTIEVEAFQTRFLGIDELRFQSPELISISQKRLQGCSSTFPEIFHKLRSSFHDKCRE